MNTITDYIVAWMNLNRGGFQKCYAEQKISDTEYILYDVLI